MTNPILNIHKTDFLIGSPVAKSIKSGPEFRKLQPDLAYFSLLHSARCPLAKAEGEQPKYFLNTREKYRASS